ncbi:hypothetical protein A3A71_00280 [Candidatus Berkelbacteria bacterium RIFCSPLOWO2_01_FULL_50_28]|uniref:Uncharacterized protein n=1 Tax=Candidatus Berkelbacteria bacterium RIFCSPLOWO2_01_FULL_50_28 TaxID=1797471 RepID=A0A1F5EB30_9BACT|nr:MAG: hypothetical protein A2807_00210 [Candidatus Berkelbacteria bacterium RIFCSPHIGHO2_01_FULL_50_36]OGD62830.1 MAG: hypothetical protein A3F39_02285 [Candidatus Berkelbacteria bacterium RIFCSPHIGHO2_12_FULL_50_11]OGD64486.1 MAG: hypothetical protein A3A71_00280 [Candidatus Berkelbacteria bacterium RIFCSPLOWO2_01_FULL_50_28]
MERKVTYIVLALGLIIGLVAGFAGGYTYQNFKAEEGGTVGTGGEIGGSGQADSKTEKVPSHYKVIMALINSGDPIRNRIRSTEISRVSTRAYRCPTVIDPGYTKWMAKVPLPFYRHIYDDSLLMDAKPATIVGSVDEDTDYPNDATEWIGNERNYEIVNTELVKKAKLTKFYQTGVQNHQKRYFLSGGDDEFFDTKVLGPLSMVQDMLDQKELDKLEPIPVCTRGKVKKVGGGAE